MPHDEEQYEYDKQIEPDDSEDPGEGADGTVEGEDDEEGTS
jgi:hypothetical protein